MKSNDNHPKTIFREPKPPQWEMSAWGEELFAPSEPKAEPWFPELFARLFAWAVAFAFGYFVWRMTR